MELVLKIPAIHCDSCIRAVRQAVETLGASLTDADVDAKLVRVRLRGDDPAPLYEQLDAVGFSATEARAGEDDDE